MQLFYFAVSYQRYLVLYHIRYRILQSWGKKPHWLELDIIMSDRFQQAQQTAAPAVLKLVVPCCIVFEENCTVILTSVPFHIIYSS